MNKWLVFPLAIMIVVFSCIIIIGNDTLSNANSSNSNYYQNITIDGSSGHVTQAAIQSSSFDLSAYNVILGVLIIGITAGIAAGIKVLGSGLSVYSQQLIMKLTVYVGIWLSMLTVTSSYFLRFNLFGPLILVLITMCYVIGFVADLNITGGE